MPGALVHIGVGILCAVIVHVMHFKWEYSFSIFIGNLLPDVIKFGILAIIQKNINLEAMDMSTGSARFLSETTSSFNMWFTFGFFLLALGLFLYHYHIIKKKKMEEYAELYGFLLIGIIIHLILDAFFFESSWLL